MKWFVAITSLVTLLLAPLKSQAQSPDDQYVRIYNSLRQADELTQMGQRRTAYEKYQEAKQALDELSKTHPEWNPSIVEFKKKTVNAKLVQFGQDEATVPPIKPIISPSDAKPTPGQVQAELPIPTAPKVPIEIQNQVKALTDEAQRLANEKRGLESKLKEALSAKPASIDPAELKKADEAIRNLQKENELLRTSLTQEQAKLAKKTDTSQLAILQKSYDTAQAKLKEQDKTIQLLLQEKKILEAKVKSPTADPQVSSLKNENEMLKKRVNELEKKTTIATAPVPVPVPVAASTARAERAEAKKIKQLESERDSLAKKLAAAEASLKKSKSRKETVKVEDLAKQLAGMQARIDVLEAKKVPFTPEEVALFTAPKPGTTPKPVEEIKTTTAASTKKSLNDLPVGAGALVAEAQRAFNTGQYDEAEKKYLQVLNLDAKNAFTLGNLAAIQMERNRMDEAEKNLKEALTVEPNDAYNTSLWGILKFRQNKFNEALDALSRSAKMDPKNAETQNYLGITLSQLGQREAAETAIRKAIQLSPDYSSAHHNLAIIYATQKPPYIELAKYHYQKALSRGHPKNAELEKIVEGKK